MDTNRYVVFFIVVLLACVVAYSIYLGKNSSQKTTSTVAKIPKDETAKPVCNAGETKPCKSDECEGTNSCKNGYWTECHINKKCVPGSTTACIENACVVGYRICNECGTDYGDCIKNNTNK